MRKIEVFDIIATSKRALSSKFKLCHAHPHPRYVAGSDAYFEQVDARIRDNFPHKFRVNKPASNVVAPASRSASGSKKITLTKTQVAIAKRLGVPLEKYAEQVAKEINNV